MQRKKTFLLNVHLKDTEESFQMKKGRVNMTIKELKSQLELLTGIPTYLQRLYYVDEGEMPDNVTLRYNGIIANPTIRMKTWFQDGWQDLLNAAAHGDITELMSLGVTMDSEYSTANSRYMNIKQKKAWIAERAFVALFIAAHRGHIDMLNFLLMNGANPNTKTRDGHTALHMAVIMGKSECIDQLILHGAEVNDVNNEGQTLLDMAQMSGHPDNFSKIYQVQWMNKKSDIGESALMAKSALFAHQKYDSTLQTWRTGTHGKIYMANLLKPGEPRGGQVSERKLPGQKRAGRNRPPSTTSPSRPKDSTKQVQKPDPTPALGNAQEGKLPTQPYNAQQKEASGTKRQGDSNGTHRPSISSAQTKLGPVTAAHPQAIE
ncbi:ankyrin repeat domain-containing protein 60-like [Scyliorhinus canicula]|uniref:ankyrin repeat domain-containing protein 60-like n=1 Tax=Scyliorhinus canicula TaxID=7830 RepID=UPI0018F6ECBC|nr:ankyrin repeat domain-containing protein 60-like [Scyliorhinus canicula]